ncbi:hypothetical protein Tco_1203440 [Tanacetum coccineum]
MNILQDVQPDAYHKLCQADPHRWSRAHFPLIRYNYMTSNSVESVNACTVLKRKLPVTILAETYHAMVQDCKYEDEITDWVADKMHKRKIKSVTWTVHGINQYQYQVTYGRYNREVNFETRSCEGHKWQLSGIPCGHVIDVTRFVGLTDYVQFVAYWFKKDKYQGTYVESNHFVRSKQEWEFPSNIILAIPPRMDNPQPGRPKNTNRIPSQGEEPRVIHCSRCYQAGHKRDQCSKAFVPELPINIRSQDNQQFLRNDQPSFYNPHQPYDDTFKSYNQYPSQPYGETTYPSQPYEQHHAQTHLNHTMDITHNRLKCMKNTIPSNMPLNI